VLELHVDGIHAGYGAVQVLHGVTLHVREGETVALLGSNGNGKSTLMKCVMGQLRPRAGRIALRAGGVETDLSGLAPQQIVNLGVALVPEGRRLFPKLSVDDNLRLGAFRPQARDSLTRNLALAYGAFPALAERRRQLAASLSGGQQQMLAIGRALMSLPQLLLIDEPSVGLSPLLVQQTMELIGSLKRSHGLTVLMAEQNFAEASRIADRGYILVHGEIAYAGASLAEMRDSPLVRSLYLGV
jgi:branched-chain amino acid transport system ATP-binding protein